MSRFFILIREYSKLVHLRFLVILQKLLLIPVCRIGDVNNTVSFSIKVSFTMSDFLFLVNISKGL